MLKRLLGAAAVLVVVIVVVQMTTPSPDHAGAPVATATRRPIATRRPTPAPSCQPVSPALLATIASGLTVYGGGSLSQGMAVKSNDFSNVYFVAARIEGPGMGRTVGLWATNSLQPGSGMIFSVDSYAREFSDWPDGAQTDARFSKNDHGARQALSCVP